MARFTVLVAALLATASVASAQVTTFAGAGAFVPGRAVTVGTDVYFTDPTNHVVRRFNIPTGALQTFAGLAGTSGDAEGTAANGLARFKAPQGICYDGTNLFVADTGNNKIKKLSTNGATTFYAGASTTAGALDSTLLLATFNGPSDCAAITTTASGVTTTKLYVVESTGNRVRVLNDTNVDAFVPSTVSTAASTGDADGAATSATFNGATGICTDGTNLFVADTGNNKIRKITVSTATTGTWGPTAGTTAAGFQDGAAAYQRFNGPTDCLASGTADLIYVADKGNHRVRRVSAAVAATVAGALTGAGDADASGGTASAPALGRLWGPVALAGDLATPTKLFVLEDGARKLRTVTLTAAGAATASAVATTTGSDNSATVFAGYTQCCLSTAGNYFCTDNANHVIRKIAAGSVTVFAGTVGAAGNKDDTGTAARFNGPWGIACDLTDLYVTDNGSGKIRKITSAGVVSTYTDATVLCTAPTGIAVIGTDLYFACEGSRIVKATTTATSTAADWAGGGTPAQIGSAADDYTSTTIPVATIPFTGVRGICAIRVGAAVDTLIVPDTGSHRILAFSTTATGLPAASDKGIIFAGVTGSAGDVVGTQAAQATAGSAATNLRFSAPNSCASNAGTGAVTTHLWISDAGNNKVKRIAVNAAIASRLVTTVAEDVWGAAAAGDVAGTAATTRFTGLVGVFREALPSSAVSTGVVAVDANGFKSFAAGPGSATLGLNGGGVGSFLHSCVKVSGDYYCSDTTRHVIWKVVGTTGVTSVFAGTLNNAGVVAGVTGTGKLNAPAQLAVFSTTFIYAYSSGANSFQKIDAGTGSIALGDSITYPSLCTAATVGQIAAAATADALFVACGTVVVKSTAGTWTCVIGASSDCATLGTTAEASATIIESTNSGTTNSANTVRTAIKLVGVKTVWVAKTTATDDTLLYVNQATSSTGTLLVTPIVGGTSNLGGKTADIVAKFGVTGFITNSLFLTTSIDVGTTVGSTARIFIVEGSGKTTGVLAHGTTVASRAIAVFGPTGFGTVSSFNIDGTLAASTLPLVAFDSVTLTVRNIANAYSATAAAAVAFVANFSTAVLTSAVAAPASGTATSGFTNAVSLATDAQFRSPHSVAQIGTNFYVTDAANHVVRKLAVNANTSTVAVTTLAGAVGTAADADWTTGDTNTARFSSPTFIVANGTDLFVADSGNNKIKKITVSASTGDATAVSIFAGPAAGSITAGDVVDAATGVAFSNPTGLALYGAWLLVADSGNNKIKRISSAGVVSIAFGAAAGRTTAGTADSSTDVTTARFNNPQGLAVNGTWLWIADKGNHKLRRCDLDNIQFANGTACVTHVGTAAGTTGATGTVDGSDLTAARLNSPTSLLFDQAQNLMIADSGNHRIRKLTAAGALSTVAGSVAGATEQALATASGAVLYSTATFSGPTGLYIDAAVPETLFVVDSGNDRVRQLRSVGSRSSTVTVTATASTSTITATATSTNATTNTTTVTATPGGTVPFILLTPPSAPKTPPEDDPVITTAPSSRGAQSGSAPASVVVAVAAAVVAVLLAQQV